MNAKQLKRREGMVLTLNPTPLDISRGKKEETFQYNKWILICVDEPSRNVEVKNATTEHTLRLGFDNVRDFRTPDYLLLRCQIKIKGPHDYDLTPLHYGPQAIIKHISRTHLILVTLAVLCILMYITLGPYLKSLYILRQLEPTGSDKVGIWIADITGDDAKLSAKRGITQKLDYFISKTADLRDLVEIRDLPAEIKGTSLTDRERHLEKLANRYNASIIISGEIAGFKIDALHSVVTIFKREGVKQPTVRLAPITEDIQIPRDTTSTYMSLGSESITLHGEYLTEPMQLARFIAALALYHKSKWLKAAELLEDFINSGGSSAIDLADAYLYLGLMTFNVYTEKHDVYYLNRAHTWLAKAVKGHLQNNNFLRYAEALTFLGVTFREQGSYTESMAVFKKAINIYYGQARWKEYGMSKTNLALTYFALSSSDKSPINNLTTAIAILKEATQVLKEQESWSEYANSKMFLGESYNALALKNVKPDENFKYAVVEFKEASALFRKTKNWSGYGQAQGRLNAMYRYLSDRSDTQENIIRLTESLKETTEVWKEQGFWNDYALSNNLLGRTYAYLAKHGINREANLKNSRDAFDEALKQCQKDEKIWACETYEENLAISYLKLAESGNDPERNFKRAISTFSHLLKSIQDTTMRKPTLKEYYYPLYPKLQIEIALAHRELASRGIDSKTNLESALRVLCEARRVPEILYWNTDFLIAEVKKLLRQQGYAGQDCEDYSTHQSPETTVRNP